ncbi:VCBS repeat-containing protein [Aliifodinibius sp. S!AR15-10]|uniref:FG-GAP repeat domain-containing protein n=1 Tax=Aliifodinibius sp. S!AR15-10 TaxID=2950437 RepID=UPI002857696B|nr:VCBS repeat-containing protein [Aliifodinibius sp. S!AR15-10]MDR8390115.1 VCBS repeat-containing protein [Aliifodinibius sp. S!AR15-10]
MKKVHVSVLAVMIIAAGVTILSSCQQSKGQGGDYTIHKFQKIQLSSAFYAEGAGIGDINQDNQPDVIAGSYWYEGPDFKTKHAYYEPREYDPYKYSDNFIVNIEDVNGDDRNDILMVGFPGEAAHWFENPGSGDDYWNRHLIHERVDNESPQFYDLNRDGQLELVFHTDGYLGYATRNADDPTQPWSFTRISEQHDWGKFTHGLGIGDIDGDGLEDIMKKEGWWKNPGKDQLNSQWEYHEVDFGADQQGGAQMYAYDVDSDGLNDVVSSLNAHYWGLAWFRQTRNEDEITFEQNIIMGDSTADNRYGVKFAEIHAIDLVDMDNDGVKDLVTGKRFWAHGPDGYDFHNNAAVLYWFKLDRSGPEVTFVPYLVDYDSGVGVEVDTGDLSGNGYPDIVVSNKKGTFVFLNQPESVSRDVWEFNRPDPIEISE